MVLAPRGGGKSAQRRMLEERCWTREVFLITYDYFFTTSGIKSAGEADLAFHLRNLNKLALINFFSHLAHMDTFDPIMYQAEEKRFLTKMVDKYLGDIEVSTIRDVVRRSMTLPAKFKRWWNENLPLVGLLSTFIKSHFHLDLGMPVKFEREGVIAEDPLTDFKTILLLVRRFGLKSCYILIDKVDETELTGNDPEMSYALIQPLIKDLRFINSSEFSVKFFLWDALEPYYLRDARPDRVQEFRLEWRNSELRNILSRRLQAYSGGHVSDLSDIFEAGCGDVTSIVISFSNNSPRNIVRIIQDIIDEHVRMREPGKLNIKSMELGVKKFCKEFARHTYGPELVTQLKRISKVGFTTSFLGSDLFRSPNAARRWIQIWSGQKVIKQVAQIPNRVGRPSPYYLIQDSTLVPVILESRSLMDIVRDMAIECNECGRTYFLHVDDFTEECIPLCPNCESHLPVVLK